MMLQIQRAVARASAVVLGHSPNEDVQKQVADVLFAKASADGNYQPVSENSFRQETV